MRKTFSTTKALKSLALLLSFVACFPAVATQTHTTLLVGNTVVRPESIETVVRGIIARVVNADINGSAMSFRANGTKQIIPLQTPSETLKEILKILGIQDNISLGISAIRTQFTLPSSGLKIEITKLSTNSFEVHARWQIESLKVSTEKLTIHVPQGLFDQAFEIESSPITVGLKANSTPIRFDVRLTTDLAETGTKIHLKSFHTNLVGRSQPDFFVNLGPLTVNNQPLVLDIGSNGNLLHADEPSIRKQFQQIEPNIIAAMRTKIAKTIQDNIEIAAKKIEAEPPIKYSFNTDQLLRDSTLAPGLKRLIGGIDGELLFSYLQYVKDTNQFSAQIAAHMCFDGQCVVNLNPISLVGTRDIQAMNKNDDVGVLLYESFVKDIVHSDSFQARIQEFYKSSGASPGVDLSKKGVRLSFDPARNSISAVLNLEIDIKKTIKAGTSLGESLKLRLGDLIEYYFGSGKIVKVPLEVNFNLVGIYPDNKGQPNILVTTSLPFTAKGEYISPRSCSYSECPSNLSEMTSVVRSGFISSLKKELGGLLPTSINIPIEKTLKVQDFQFNPKYIRITPNRGLLISAELKDEGTI
jgi:hypothetical protein